jgi:hypothetical protein
MTRAQKIKLLGSDLGKLPAWQIMILIGGLQGGRG